MRQLKVSTGASVHAAPEVVSMTWDELLTNLNDYQVSDETLAEYLAWPKDRQLKKKDVGWFAGAAFEGRRSNATARSFDLISLDIEGGGEETWAALAAIDPMLSGDGFEHFIGSTRKHSAQAPRLRVVIPLSREATPDEAEALRRAIASRIGMGLVDPTCLRTAQVSFWPSRCADGAQVTERVEGPWLDVDAALRRYYPSGWEDASAWPRHGSESEEQHARAMKHAGDPSTKPGLVGHFCALWDVPRAAAEFLPGVYEIADDGERATFTGGTSANGAVIYDGGAFIYSHHATDPCGGKLCNAWDMVRLHRFGHLDAKAKGDTPVNRLPSQGAMQELAGSLEQVRARVALGGGSGAPMSAAQEFADEARVEAVTRLAGRLEVTKSGDVRASHDNVVQILREHPALAGAIGINRNSGLTVWRRFAPWHDRFRRQQRIHESEGLCYSDHDDILLRAFIRTEFPGLELVPLQVIREAVMLVANEGTFHPIREYLEHLPAWDGVQRVGTMLRDYAGAEDTPYVRGVSRVMMVASVARIMDPGCKYESMPVLIGAQGVGKSRLAAALAGNRAWFVDSLPPVDSKDAVELIRGAWWVEVAELANMNRAEVEHVKAFLSRQVDKARLAYERSAQEFPRQCVMLGTTNDEAPLRDQTGNRRFWPVVVGQMDPEAVALVRDQLYAEALALWRSGSRLYLEGEEAQGASEAQAAAMPQDAVGEVIDAWLDGHAKSRRAPSEGGWDDDETGARRRDVVCIRQIAVEALGHSETGTDWPSWLQLAIRRHMQARGDFEGSRVAARVPGYGVAKAYRRRGPGV